jgi:hypothetical protein
MKKNFQKKKFISDLPTLIFSRYETGTTGIFLRLGLSHHDEYPPFLGGIQFSLINADN